MFYEHKHNYTIEHVHIFILLVNLNLFNVLFIMYILSRQQEFT